MVRVKLKRLSEYCKDNILVVPQALQSMEDVVALMSHGDIGVFYKCLQGDLTNVEFYTNTPCFVYIESGLEVITTSDNETHQLTSGTVLFLPQGRNLHSDFVRATDSLRAYLVFVDDVVISEYLKTRKKTKKTETEEAGLFSAQCGVVVESFFKSIQAISKERGHSSELLRIKLIEFLHLLALLDEASLNNCLSNRPKTLRPKRNIARLLESNEILHLSIDDLSHLSGRSLSSFNRDFRAIYNMPPKRWLQEKRLIHARELLMDGSVSVTEVAGQIGYDNVSHFIKLFKEISLNNFLR